MKQEEDFYQYLTERFRSESTGMPLSKKAAGDVLSRLRRVERVLKIELDKSKIQGHKYDDLVDLIKENRALLGATAGRPYAFSVCVHALKHFRAFHNNKVR